MNFNSGKIAGYLFWGFFENHPTATAVIHDLKNALENGNTLFNTYGNITRKLSGGKYVIAFKLNNILYITYRDYYSFLATPDGIWRPRKKLDSVEFPVDGVLVLGKEYIDDIPAYTDAKKFCNVIDDNYLQQYCIPF